MAYATTYFVKILVSWLGMREREIVHFLLFILTFHSDVSRPAPFFFFFLFFLFSYFILSLVSLPYFSSFCSHEIAVSSRRKEAWARSELLTVEPFAPCKIRRLLELQFRFWPGETQIQPHISSWKHFLLHYKPELRQWKKKKKFKSILEI